MNSICCGDGEKLLQHSADGDDGCDGDGGGNDNDGSGAGGDDGEYDGGGGERVNGQETPARICQNSLSDV